MMNFFIAIALLRFTSDVSLTEFYASGRDLVNRDAQLPPPDLSWCWLFLGGRGAGKSHYQKLEGEAAQSHAPGAWPPEKPHKL
jgi:phage terminase large subunit-like protein